jgi:hypothetical protein
MQTSEGTDARVLAGVVALTAVVFPVVGLVIVRGAPFDLTGRALVPLLLAAAAFLVMMLVVDPVLAPRQRPSRDEVHVWLTKSFTARLPAIELPVLAALVIAMVERDRGVLLTGALGTLVLAALWWPGEQFFGVMRRRLQPLRADNLVDDLLAATNGRLFLRAR